jgi:hypothetical protein
LYSSGPLSWRALLISCGLSVQPDRAETTDDTGEGVLSPNSLSRQLADQMTLCKSYAVIAKENSNLDLAWHLSAQIRASQQLLSLVWLFRPTVLLLVFVVRSELPSVMEVWTKKSCHQSCLVYIFWQAATRGTPITWEEAEPIMREMSSLIYRAKELHYDSATMLMKLKAEMQVLWHDWLIVMCCERGSSSPEPVFQSSLMLAVLFDQLILLVSWSTISLRIWCQVQMLSIIETTVVSLFLTKQSAAWGFLFHKQCAIAQCLHLSLGYNAEGQGL